MTDEYGALVTRTGIPKNLTQSHLVQRKSHMDHFSSSPILRVDTTPILQHLSLLLLL
jgi:hypothetical protein